MINLRDYQLKAHEQIIDAFKKKQNALLVMPTGAGKSLTVVSFVDKYKHHFKFILIVRTRGLVFQLEEDLKLFNLDYSILMAGEQIDLNKRIILASKDTLESRSIYPFQHEENVVMIWDEADETPDFQKEILSIYRKDRFFFLGQTATPFAKLDHYDVALTPIKARELNKMGVLVDYKYFIPKQIDYSDTKIVNGEWKKSDIVNKLDNPKAIADGFEAYLNFGDNRQTLIFAINKSHSKRIVEYINNYYGKETAIHCDADTKKDDREIAKKKFREGKIRFLSNVRLFTRGTNIIEIGCIWDQAGTLSLNNHIQKLGRGSRKNPIYKDCIVIDVANNVLNNGHFYQEHKIDLTSKYKKTKEDIDDLSMRVCKKCFRAGEVIDFGSSNICPYCGFKNEPVKKKTISKYMKNKIFMENASEEAIEQKKMINDFKKILWKKKNIGKKYQNDIARLKAFEDMVKKYGLENVLKIKKSMGLKDELINKFKHEQYKPLGGMM